MIATLQYSKKNVYLIHIYLFITLLYYNKFLYVDLKLYKENKNST